MPAENEAFLSLNQEISNAGRCAPRKRHVFKRGGHLGSVGKVTMTRLCPVLRSGFIISVMMLNVPVPSQAQIARDPGPRATAPGAGKPLDSLTGPQINLFNAGIAEFNKHD